MANTKVKELKFGEMGLKAKIKAMQVMDEIRRMHKTKKGEKTSEEIIRHLRDTRYSR
jgi:hypothetical protein